MIKATPATNLQPVYFEWDEKFKVLIKQIPQAKILNLVKSNEETSWNSKHQKTTETNWLKYGKEFMREAIIGWEGLTYRCLLEICRPFDLEPGVKLDDPIEFSQEHLGYILDNYRPVFSAFVTHGIDRLDEIYTEQKKKELENL